MQNVSASVSQLDSSVKRKRSRFSLICIFYLQQNEPKKENRVSDLEPLIKSLSIKDAMSSEEYISVDADVFRIASV